MAKWKTCQRPNRRLSDWAASLPNRRGRYDRMEDITATILKNLQLGLIIVELEWSLQLNRRNRHGRVQGSPTRPRHGLIGEAATKRKTLLELNRKLLNLALSRLDRRARRDRAENRAAVESKGPRLALVLAKSERSLQSNGRHHFNRIEGFPAGPHQG